MEQEKSITRMEKYNMMVNIYMVKEMEKEKEKNIMMMENQNMKVNI